MLINKRILWYTFEPSNIYGWDTFGDLPRYFFFFFNVASVYFFLNKNKSIFAALFFLSLLFSFYAHPSNAVILSSIFFLTTIYYYLKSEISIRFILILIIVMILGVSPNLLKLSDLVVASVIDNKLWYSLLIKNESEDFSTLYIFTDELKRLIYYLIFCCFLSIFSIISKHKNYSLVLSLNVMMLSPFLLLSLCFLIEIASIYTNQFQFISFIIQLQPGLKLISFSYIPAIILLSLILKNYLLDNLNIKVSYILTGVFLSLITLQLSFSLIKHNEIKFHTRLFQQIVEIKENKFYEMIRIYSRLTNKGNPSLPTIYTLPGKEIVQDHSSSINLFKITYHENKFPKHKINKGFMNAYDKLEVYENLIKAIRSKITKGSKIITPPYLHTLRDSLIEYEIFFQERYDGNLMIGSKKIASIFHERMKSLLKVDYRSLPTPPTNLFNTYLRHEYLALNKSDILLMKEKYKDYSYLITESNHHLNFPIIHKDQSYVIYKI
tara:strand:+ start:10620 stop:12101 length:1482 start_codon:yes stop_codon:yes gene_type:complete